MVVLKVRVRAHAADNLGLALALVDLVQDPANPQQLSLPPGRRTAAMAGFDWPRGYANPVKRWTESGFGGTPVRNELGGTDLVQIGGAQNTFGIPGPCLGPHQDRCVGQDVVVDPGVAQGPAGEVLATITFPAPAVSGTYAFHLENPLANTLTAIQAPPAVSGVREAATAVPAPTVTFAVP
jgi:hypothetical protein